MVVPEYCELVAGARSQIRAKLSTLERQFLFIENRLNAAILTGSARNSQPLKEVLDLLVNYTDPSGFIRYVPQPGQGSAYLTASILQSLASEEWTTSLIPAALKAKLATATKQVLSGTLDRSYYGDKEALAYLQVLYATVADRFGDTADIAMAKSLAEQVAALGAADVKKKSNMELAAALALVTRWKGAGLLNTAVFQEMTATTRVRYAGNQATVLGAPIYSAWGYCDETIDSAIILKAISEAGGSADLARPFAVGLVNASRSNWYVTRTMVQVASALNAFSARYEATPVAGKTQVDLQAAQVSQAIDWATQPSGLKVTTPWTAPRETLTVAHAGPGQPWVSVSTRTAVPLTAPMNQVLSIEKSIRNITRVGGYFQSGDLVEVTLTIHAASAV